MVCRGDAGMVEVIRVQLWSNSKPLVHLGGDDTWTRGEKVMASGGGVWWMVMQQVRRGERLKKVEVESTRVNARVNKKGEVGSGVVWACGLYGLDQAFGYFGIGFLVIFGPYGFEW